MIGPKPISQHSREKTFYYCFNTGKKRREQYTQQLCKCSQIRAVVNDLEILLAASRVQVPSHGVAKVVKALLCIISSNCYCFTVVINEWSFFFPPFSGARSALNGVSSYIDASHIYGLSDDVSRNLREFRGGLLKSQPLKGGQKGLKELPPPRTEKPDQGCRRPNKNTFCFLTGDPRANQQMMLASMHILILREHNRIARELSKINQRWDDERIFQVGRKYFFFFFLNTKSRPV